VGGGLPPIAEDQLQILRLTDCNRGQAPSHICLDRVLDLYWAGQTRKALTAVFSCPPNTSKCSPWLRPWPIRSKLSSPS